MSGKTLFTLPIDATGGNITVTEPADAVYLLTFTSGPDNRLHSDFLQAFLLALDILEYKYPHGVVISTSGIPKFYSNGLDLGHVAETPNFFPDSLLKLFARLVSYPMPTVAWINGHGFAGGLLLAMHHDYRVFNPSRGFVCMNELDFGAPLNPALLGIFEAKLTPTTYRNVILEAKRFNGPAALEAGIVDALGGWEEVQKLVGERQLVTKPGSKVYGVLKQQMYRQVIANHEGFDAQLAQERINEAVRDKKRAEERERVEDWEAKAGKAKL
jgi:enoyl-CoA hydratase/carnithine racemase